MVGTLFLSVPGILSAKEKTDTLILNLLSYQNYLHFYLRLN